jgi:hypothetical protein
MLRRIPLKMTTLWGALSAFSSSFNPHRQPRHFDLYDKSILFLPTAGRHSERSRRIWLLHITVSFYSDFSAPLKMTGSIIESIFNSMRPTVATPSPSYAHHQSSSARNTHPAPRLPNPTTTDGLLANLQTIPCKPNGHAYQLTSTATPCPTNH